MLGIEGMQLAELKGVQFEISPLAAEGTFPVNAKLLGVQLEWEEISRQELLQLQYGGVSVMDMFGRVRINVNLIIFLRRQQALRQEQEVRRGAGGPACAATPGRVCGPYVPVSHAVTSDSEPPSHAAHGGPNLRRGHQRLTPGSFH